MPARRSTFHTVEWPNPVAPATRRGPQPVARRHAQLTGRVRFLRHDIRRTLIMEDGEQFTVFRHAKLKAPGEPAAAFVVRFTPAHMSVRQNIRFSLLPMIPQLGMHGFREKLWCVNEKTGMCQGVYALADPHRRRDLRRLGCASLHDRPLGARLGLPPHPRPVPGTLLGVRLAP
jgi:hypothetical protein